MSDSEQVITLFRDEYAVVLNTVDGTQTLQEGPLRFVVEPQQVIESRGKKTVLAENEFCVVVSPYDRKTKKYRFGDREVRTGPCEFSLWPWESVETKKNVYVLNQNQSLICTALPGHPEHPAGHRFKINGPTKYVPLVRERVDTIQDSINVGQNQALYVRNIRSGEISMILGPQVYSLDQDSELYYKSLSPSECRALELVNDGRVSVNSEGATSAFAYSIALAENECICVYDRRSHEESYVVGPCVHLLEPYSHVKVMSLSADVPKREDQVLAARIRFGQDFMNDRFVVRTKDNAVLQLDLSYKWCFLVPDQNDKQALSALFKVEDFIGVACQTLASFIREEASLHNFEDFHAHSGDLIRKRLFKYVEIPDGMPISNYGRLFSENLFYVFGVDVKSMTPIDHEIATLLEQGIKSNMRILCAKLEDAAQISAEKEEIMHKCELEKMRQAVIIIENKNMEREQIERARIEGQAVVEQARAAAAAKRSTEMARIEGEVRSITVSIEALSAAENGQDAAKRAELYLKLREVSGMHNSVSKATIIPSHLQKFTTTSY
jgi:major vault protein